MKDLYEDVPLDFSLILRRVAFYPDFKFHGKYLVGTSENVKAKLTHIIVPDSTVLSYRMGHVYGDAPTYRGWYLEASTLCWSYRSTPGWEVSITPGSQMCRLCQKAENNRALKEG